MKRARLTPTRAVLVMAAIGLVSVMALPGRHSPPTGALPGVVRGPDGRPVRECLVALFDGDALELLETARTDQDGRFAFQKSPWAFHVFASPEPSTGLVGAWLLARDSTAPGELELDLVRGRRATIEVRDEKDVPLPDVEVRAYRTGTTPTVVVRARTDASGQARLVVPERVHLAAVPDGEDRLPAWDFDRTVPETGGFFPLVLRPGRRLTGRVVLEDGRRLQGVVVSSWETDGARWTWNGFGVSDDFGNVTVPGSGEGTELRAVSPDRPLLPVRRVVRSAGPLEDFVLREGRPLEVLVADVSQRGRPARVWIWSEEANAWGWGARTDVSGRVATSVTELFSAVAEPLEAGALPSEAWDQVYGGPRLVLVPGSTGR